MPGWTVDTLKEYFDGLRATDQEATRIALDAAKEKAIAHNGLIAEMQRKETLYVTKSSLYLALIGVVGVVTATVATLAFILK